MDLLPGKVVPLKECYKSSTISTKQTRSKMIDVDFNIKKNLHENWAF